MLSIINLFDKTREPANARHKKTRRACHRRQVHHKVAHIKRTTHPPYQVHV